MNRRRSDPQADAWSGLLAHRPLIVGICARTRRPWHTLPLPDLVADVLARLAGRGGIPANARNPAAWVQVAATREAHNLAAAARAQKRIPAHVCCSTSDPAIAVALADLPDPSAPDPRRVADYPVARSALAGLTRFQRAAVESCIMGDEGPSAYARRCGRRVQTVSGVLRRAREHLSAVLAA